MSEQKPDCPVCKEHTESDAIASQGVLFSGMQAILDRDHATVQAVYDSLTPWDAHVAITLLLSYAEDICFLTDQDLPECLALMRQEVLSAQAELS